MSGWSELNTSHWQPCLLVYHQSDLNAASLVLGSLNAQKRQTLWKAAENQNNCVDSAVNFVATDSYMSTIEGSVFTHNQSTNCDPSIKCVTVSCAGDPRMSPAIRTTILGGLMNENWSRVLEQPLEELHKYGPCSTVKTQAGLCGQTAAWLNVIIVMQQWVFFSDKEMRV